MPQVYTREAASVITDGIIQIDLPDLTTESGWKSYRIVLEDWITANPPDHTILSNLGWTASGHTGTADTIPAFDGDGDAELISKNSFEMVSNRRSTFQETPDNLHYITEKLAKDSLDLKADLTDVAILADTTNEAPTNVLSISTNGVWRCSSSNTGLPDGVEKTGVLFSIITTGGELYLLYLVNTSDVLTLWQNFGEGALWVGWQQIGGGGGSSYTFNNGLTEALGIVKFGGSLLANTDLHVGSWILSFDTNNGEIHLQSGTSEIIVWDGAINLESNGNSLSISEDGSVFIGEVTAPHLNTDIIDFNLTPAQTIAPGRLMWNATDKTASLGREDGGSYELGQEVCGEYIASGFTPALGDFVSVITGTGNQNFVELTDATDQLSAYACIGLVTAIYGGSHVVVTKIGKNKDLNTNAYNEGDVIYCDPLNRGKWTSTKPVAPNYTIIGGVISVKSATVGIINVKVIIIPKLSDLSDIFGAIASGETVRYTSGNAFEFVTDKPWHGLYGCGTPTFNGTTHEFSTDTALYYYNGKKVYVASNVCDMDTYVTLAAYTLYYFYFDDATGVMKCKSGTLNLRTEVPLFTGYWNGSELAIGIEKHNPYRDIDWHINAHNTIGTRYGAGLSLTYPSSGHDSSLQIESGNIFDEDQNLTISIQTYARFWHKVDASHFTFVNISESYYHIAPATPLYLNTNTYALTEYGTQYACFWVYANNDYTYPVAIMPTHAAAAHTTLASARAESPPTLAGFGLNPEWKLIYRYIIRGNGTFMEVADYRLSSPLPSGGLANVSAASVTSLATTNILSTNLQSDKNEIDIKLLGFTTTATADGTTTLDVNNTYNQEFTGTSNQTVVMPVVSTLTTGRPFKLINSSTGILTVNSSGGNLITTIAAGATAILECVLITGTGASSWSVENIFKLINQIAYTTAIPFNREFTDIETHTLDANDTLIINTTGAIDNGGAQLLFINDHIHTPVLTAFHVIGDYDNIFDYSLLTFKRHRGLYLVSILNFD